jgi:flagellar hook-associated protein 3 FlgL
MVATGIRVEKPSDDPVAAAEVMRINHALRAVEQFRRNTSAARVRVSAEESVLNQVSDILTRVKEVGVGQATDTASASNRFVAGEEVDRLLQQVIQLGNTRIGNDYIFGGSATSSPPFQGTTYVGDDTVHQSEIGSAFTVDTNQTGRELFVDSGVFSTLQNLRDAMRTDDVDGIRAGLTALESGFENVQVHLTSIGARSREIDMAMVTHDETETNLLSSRSDLREIDFEKATTEFLSTQTSLQAARAAASRFLETALTNFLR